jgi:hypothetical protein
VVCGRLQRNSRSFFYPIQIPLSPDKHTVCPQSPLGVSKNCGAQTNWASHVRFAADYSETVEVFFYPIQIPLSPDKHTGVHKVHSGFWKIVARKQIELATCGLRQITAKLWKFFYPIQIPLSPNIQGVHKVHSGLWKIVAQTNWASHVRFVADYSESLEVFYWPLPSTQQYLCEVSCPSLNNTVCPQSPLGVLKNCGAQTD